MFLKPYGYTNEVSWWDICADYYEEGAPTSGEDIVVGYKWCIHPDILWENDASYSSRKDGHIEHITPYAFHQAPDGVTWENECSLGEWWRQVEVLSPEWLKPLVNPHRAISRWWFWKQRAIDRFLNENWWDMPTYRRRRRMF